VKRAIRRRRVVVHDYAGHPFQVELSRALAGRGYDVLHLYCSAYVSGKGALERRASDQPTFSSEPIRLDRFDKHTILRRATQEISYGRALARRIRDARPDVVLSANTPVLAQMAALRAAHACRSSFIYWLQDLIGVGAQRVLRHRMPFGSYAAAPLAALERRALRRSDAVVSISEDFSDLLGEWNIPVERIAVIENWAPLAELPERPRDNAWARDFGLVDKRVLLYSGTLGLKHNPELLLSLARRFKSKSDVRVVVISEGSGAELLAEAKRSEQLDALVLLPFQPFERLPDVMASATALVAILERDAGVFSVPSKVLSYLCAGRPILGALPEENLAARTLLRAGAGVIVDPDDVAGFVAAAEHLLEDSGKLERLGIEARRYAGATFDISKIADQFEHVFGISGRTSASRMSLRARFGGAGARSINGRSTA
jgi:colanic acid biosynthesis glycosyl transferase WcaI